MCDDMLALLRTLGCKWKLQTDDDATEILQRRRAHKFNNFIVFLTNSELQQDPPLVCVRGHAMHVREGDIGRVCEWMD